MMMIGIIDTQRRTNGIGLTYFNLDAASSGPSLKLQPITSHWVRWPGTMGLLDARRRSICSRT